MKIHKALKVKNRLVGSINALREVARRENSRRDDSTSTVNMGQVLSALAAESAKLVRLKTAIALATAPISGLLVQLAEAKDSSNFFNTLPTRSGTELVSLGREVTKTYTWVAHVGREDLDKIQSICRDEVANLQDKIDDFNAKTDVNFAE